MTKRIERLLTKLAQEQLDGVLITNLKNIYYLTDFWGSAGTVFISQNRRIFITDDRYALLAKQTIKDFDIIVTRDTLPELAKAIADDGLTRIGFEADVTYGFYQALTTVFQPEVLRATTNLVESLRLIKDAQEVATIKQACAISDQAFADVLEFIKVGKTDQEVANFLDYRMRELGGGGVSFDTISVSGARSAMPHGTPSPKRIEAGDALTLDFGTWYNHYASDMTRTVFVGHVTDEQATVYQTVLAANQAVIKETKAGLTYAQYDGTARAVIEEAGYGPYFTHGIGHGLGLDVHELPFFGKDNPSPLQAGMVITDEPGIYLDGQFGVRIEDDLLVTETGCEILTLAPKELILL